MKHNKHFMPLTVIDEPQADILNNAQWILSTPRMHPIKVYCEMVALTQTRLSYHQIISLMKSEDSFIIYMEQNHIEVYVHSRLARENSVGKKDLRWPFCLELRS